MSILVTGPTGNVGKEVVAQLVSKGVSFRVASRNPEKFQGKEGVTAVYADLDKSETLSKALEGIKRVFLYTKPQGIDGFIKEAEKAGVEYVVLLSSYTTAEPAPIEGKPHLIRDVHLKVEEALRKSSLKWTFLRPASFHTNAFRSMQKSIKHQREFKTPYPGAHTTPVDERDIAEVAVVALTTDKLIGATPVITGPESLTQQQYIDIISKAINQPIKVEVQDPKEAWDHLKATFSSPAVADAILDVLSTRIDKLSILSQDFQNITGHEPRTFAAWVQENVDAFL